MDVKFKKGDRVVRTAYSHYGNIGDVATVDEDGATIPNVIPDKYPDKIVCWSQDYMELLETYNEYQIF